MLTGIFGSLFEDEADLNDRGVDTKSFHTSLEESLEDAGIAGRVAHADTHEMRRSTLEDET